MEVSLASEDDDAHAHGAVEKFVCIDGYGIRFFYPLQQGTVLVQEQRRTSPARIHMIKSARLPGQVSDVIQRVDIACFRRTGDPNDGNDF